MTDFPTVAALQDLGTRIARAWKLQNHNPHVFPKLATKMLSSDLRVTPMHPSEVLRWALERDPSVLQSTARFGSPAILVFQHPYFVIEVLHWSNRNIDPHEHSFDGSFRILCGGSLHVPCVWEEHDRINALMSLGQLRPSGWELLGVGDTRPIHSGAKSCHVLMHLENPSVTAVVKSSQILSTRQDVAYISPSVRVVSLDLDARRLDQERRILHAMKAFEDTSFTLLTRYIATHDAEEGFWVIFDYALSRGMDPDGLATIIERYRATHGARADFLPPLIAERRRQRTLLRRIRGQPLAPQARTLLAALLLLERRKDILAVMRERLGDQPAPRIAQLLRQLGQISPDGTYTVLDFTLRSQDVASPATVGPALVEALVTGQRCPAQIAKHADIRQIFKEGLSPTLRRLSE